MLELLDVSKRFGGVRALNGVSLTLTAPGTVHALLGENGSGKSTLLGVMSGQTRPDEGQIKLGGRPAEFSAPLDALRHGIAMVSQETAVCESLSVAENILLGRLVRGRGGIDWPGTHRRAAEMLAKLGLEYDTHWTVGRLRPDQRQLVEIARALASDARVLILDEPTSSLTDDEVQGLFGAVKELTAGGVSVLFVSHRLPEIWELADELTVLRDGRTVAAGPIDQFDTNSLVTAMVGDQTTLHTTSQTAPGTVDVPPTLTVAGLTSGRDFADIDLQLRPGEIVGLAGLVGAGRSELLEALFGVRTVDAGSITIEESEYRPRDPRHAIDSGIAFVPGDRKHSGLVLSMSAQDNMTMVTSANRSRLSVPDRRREGAAFQAFAESMRLRTDAASVPVGSLSGGNQQKVVLAKWLATDPKVLLLDEPTRGVDVAAKAEIHQHLREAADRGLAILASSSENPELLELCDRIIVMFRGRVVSCLSREEASEATLARLAGGHS